MSKTSKESRSTLYLGHISDTAAHVHNYYKYKYICLKKSSLIEKKSYKSQSNGLIDCLISLFSSCIVGERGRQKSPGF